MDASDTCEQLSYSLKTMLCLLWESHVNILVLTNLFSAVSCYFPGPNGSLQATRPCVGLCPAEMYVCLCVCNPKARALSYPRKMQ